MGTTKSYTEETSICSSNNAQADTSRLKQFDQQEGKRQRKKPSLHIHKMEGFKVLINHEDSYLTLLEKVCNGENKSIGKFGQSTFWEKFASQLITDSGMGPESCNAELCEEYNNLLQMRFISIQSGNGGAAYSAEHINKLCHIYNNQKPPSSLRGTTSRTTSSVSAGRNARLGTTLDKRVHTALGVLVSSKKLKFEHVHVAKDYIAETETHANVFLTLEPDCQATFLKEWLEGPEAEWEAEWEPEGEPEGNQD